MTTSTIGLQPRVVLTEWPQPQWVRFLGLRSAPPGEEADLLRRLPPPAESAWATARQLTAWTARQWKHDGNNDAEGLTAVELLNRAASGERFRCVEYTTVLAQALNARGIPARDVHALQENYDRPVTGMGHVVVEAWIEDLDQWVVLDPQNQAYWSDDHPLSAVELWRHYRRGGRRPDFMSVDGTVGDESEADYWWKHWADIAVGGSALTDERGYAAVFQGRFVLGRSQLITDPALCYPRLSAPEVAVRPTDAGEPALALTAIHPYSTGLSIDGTSYRTAAVYPLSLDIGEHVTQICLQTTWNGSAPHVVKYHVSPQP